MILKMVLSLSIICLSLAIWNSYKRKSWFNLIAIVLLVLFLILIYLKKYDINLFFLCLYSASLILLLYMMRFLGSVLQNRYNKTNHNFKQRYLSIISFIKLEGMIILFTIYQLVLIWYPQILDGIFKW